MGRVASSPALNAQFIPYDLDNYRFSTVPGLSRAEQENSFRALNQYVLATNPNTATIELIQGWYPTATSVFHDNFIPTGWAGQETLYNNVVKPTCRMCHIVLGPDVVTSNPNVTFSTYANFASQADHIAWRVCGTAGALRYRYAMPNAKQTFDQFWSNTSPSLPPGQNESATLLAFLMAQGITDDLGNPVTTCALPSWLP